MDAYRAKTSLPGENLSLTMRGRVGKETKGQERRREEPARDVSLDIREPLLRPQWRR
jgi:hypothetical protein